MVCAAFTAMKQYDGSARWLYRGGHPSRFARLQNRAAAAVFAAGIFPNRTAELQVRGRRSGRVISFPVVIADFEGGRYLVSMLGENANWVRNLKAADSQAVLRHGRRETVRLEKVDVAARAPILRRYLRIPARRRCRAEAPRALNRSTWKTSMWSHAAILEDMLQRRVGDQAAVPVIVGADLDHRQRRRQGAARHDVLRDDFGLRAVEIDEVAVPHVDRADGVAHRRAVEEVEIDQAEQRLPQRRGVVEGGGGLEPRGLIQGSAGSA